MRLHARVINARLWVPTGTWEQGGEAKLENRPLFTPPVCMVVETRGPLFTTPVCMVVKTRGPLFTTPVCMVVKN